MKIIILFLVQVASASIVTTSTGQVRGTAALEDNVEAFLGIPYAEPPVGDLRFAKPIPKKSWNGIYDASNMPPPCMQMSYEPYYFMPDISNMSEDCLYLNIWSPKSNSSDGLRPIIIFLHPGLYITGSASTKVHDGSKLASRGSLIVASVNYRLGSLGYFLGLTEDAPGNMGTYDQLMAIRWIKENAEHFRGNPENIVLLGSSAGAFTVSALILSPLSQNLFKRAIMQGGSVMHPFFEDDNARLLQNSKTVASAVGCTNQTVNLESRPDLVIDCLKRKPADDLLDAEKIMLKSNPAIFFPRVNDEVLPESPVNLIHKGKFRKDVDVLMGINKDEGTMMITIALPEYFGYYGRNNMEIPSKKRAAYIFRAAGMLTKQPNFSEIVDFYMKTVTNRTSTGYTKVVADFVGDFVIACNVVFMANFLSLKGIPVYFYKFAFRAASTPTAEWMGTTHVDEIQYVFGNPYHENFTAEEEQLTHLLMDRWSAFARTGNPNIPGHMPWLRYSYHNPLYLNFGQEEESIRLNPRKTCEIWKKRYRADIDAPLIRFLRNSELNVTMENPS